MYSSFVCFLSFVQNINLSFQTFIYRFSSLPFKNCSAPSTKNLFARQTFMRKPASVQNLRSSFVAVRVPLQIPRSVIIRPASRIVFLTRGDSNESNPMSVAMSMLPRKTKSTPSTLMISDKLLRASTVSIWIPTETAVFPLWRTPASPLDSPTFTLSNPKPFQRKFARPRRPRGGNRQARTQKSASSAEFTMGKSIEAAPESRCRATSKAQREPSRARTGLPRS